MAVCEKCLEKIKAESIKPRSRCFFMFKEAIIGLAIPVLVILSLFIFTLSLITILETDFDIFYELEMSFLHYVVSSIPFLTLGIFFILIFVAERLYRKTEFGYRTSRSKIIFFGSLIIFFGVLFIFVTKIASSVDKLVEESPEVSNVLKPMKMRAWNNPDKGLLAGKVEKFESAARLDLVDISSRRWIVDITNVSESKKKNILEGDFVKFTGKRIPDRYLFVAEDARPWRLQY